MKPLTTEEKAKLYEEAIEQAKKELATCGDMNCDAARQIFRLFPELKESEDERIRKRIIHALHGDVLELSEIKEAITWLERQKEFVSADFDDVWETADCNELTAPLEKYSKDAIKEMCHAWYDKGIELERRNWLEKQGGITKLSEEEQNRFAKGVLSSCALSFIDYLDAHKYEGKMCVSNGECEDIENAFHNAMWDRLHRYYCKYIEKQGEKKPLKVDFHDLLMDVKFGIDPSPKQGEKKSFDYENANMQQNDFAPKSATEATKGEKVDSQNCVKSVDKVEHKFEVGNWITFYGGKPFKILDIKREENGSLDYLLLNQDGHNSYYNKKYVDTNAKLWTIADAKPGDVLAAAGYIILFKKLLPHDGGVSYCHYDYACTNPQFNFNEDDNWFFNEKSEVVHPATEEQIKLLFVKMKEAGYEWDAKKKEPKRIEPQPSQWNISDFRTWQYIVCDVLTKYNGIGQYLDNGLCKQIAKYMQENWSKNLIQPQNTWKPSDEQMEAMNTLIINIVRNPLLLDNFTQANLKTLYDDLKKLREE